MKAMLIWSDGTEINQSIYEDKDGVSGVDRAVAVPLCYYLKGIVYWYFRCKRDNNLCRLHKGIIYYSFKFIN